MKALSFMQPWLFAILHGRSIDNRSWYCRFRGPVLLHASKRPWEDYAGASEWIGRVLGIKVPAFKDLPRGGIAGVANVVDCKGPLFRTDDWVIPGQFGIVLADVKALPFIPCRGALGFFEVERFVGGTP